MTDQVSRLFRSMPGSAPPLKIGVLLNGWALPRVFRAVLEDIRASNFASLSVLVFNDAKPTASTSLHGVSRYIRTLTDKDRRGHALFSAYEAWVEPRLAIQNDPLELVDCGDILAGVPTLHVVPQDRGSVHRFPHRAIERLRSEGLDVLLRFGFNILRGEILDVARFGVWSYHHGDNEFYRGLPPAFWEMEEGNPVTGVVLQRLTDELDGGLVLLKANFTTYSAVSVARNRYGPYWGGRHFVIQKLLELRRDGWPALLERAVPPVPYSGRRRLYRRPTNLDVLRWGWRRVLPYAWSRFRERSLAPTWEIGLRSGSPPLYAQPSGGPPFTFNAGPAQHFWADPVLAEYEGACYVFFEDYDAVSERGVIGVAEVDEQGRMMQPRTVLERPYHLSYPFVFQGGSDWYMVPETASAGVVELYRAVRFPDYWERVQTLLELAGLDTTLFEHAGRWWMFTTPDLGRNHAAITLLFSADALQGPWIHHPQSPVSSDVRVARSAGPVIRDGERLLRVSQNCAEGYGRNLVFSEILELTPTSYRERILSQAFAPRATDTGTHTYGRSGAWEVIDTQHLAPQVRGRR